MLLMHVKPRRLSVNRCLLLMRTRASRCVILDQLMEADENKQLKVWSSEVERRDVYLTAKKTSPSWKKVTMHKTVDVENDKVIQIKYIGDKTGAI